MSDERARRERIIGAELPAGWIEKHGLIDPSTVEVEREADEVEVAVRELAERVAPTYTNRHGQRCSDACGEGRHAECTETLDTCHCTYRGLHKTMHAYATIPQEPELAERVEPLPPHVVSAINDYLSVDWKSQATNIGALNAVGYIGEQVVRWWQSRAEPPAPLHPIEIRISIGAEDWNYVRRVLWECYRDVDDGEPLSESFGGGAGGSYSVTIAHRDLTKEQFREELERWRKSLK